MEHGDQMTGNIPPGTRRLLLPLVLALASLLVASPTRAQSDGMRLVLVASASSPVDSLELSEIRRLYLGVPVAVAGQNIAPLRYTERLAQEVFLQKVLFMSLQAYERQIVTRTFQSGRPKPDESTHASGVTESLLANPFTVSYLPEDVARKARGIKIIGILGSAVL
jgi:hypothetical protein